MRREAKEEGKGQEPNRIYKMVQFKVGSFQKGTCIDMVVHRYGAHIHTHTS